ncbi:hypothetical protein RRU94_03275 [Domibacillus sp. DTU_2020_1001157_1_SI_ALB_TIR_016]|uniref:hypothetical protein n=1 Tax=Domibacillus sp. DTU_2020_1001157_1_SI_ALB_TIR_016 TaxID=3077789 RepID=UPI0028E9B1AD|nr:hypothetical protein [Domibacillus sp. DTU_2020_1001157_1_SI_ALB_TIR_016]WNS78975.1 hypothetical protein RRU94_03275 [Domibacillus sp. DTU_2020_1001157_1_SI_ALB_TIR_016]
MIYIILGVVCSSISLIFLFMDVRQANSTKEKWLALLEHLMEPFVGFTALFYLGILLILFGWIG